MIRLLESPTLARWLKSFTDSISDLPFVRLSSSEEPASSKPNTAPGPSGRYFFAFAWSGWSGRPA